jgi:hypothetical protein
MLSAKMRCNYHGAFCGAFCHLNSLTTIALQFDNPILKPAGAASAPFDDGSGLSGIAAATPRQRIDIVNPVDVREAVNMSTNSRALARDSLVHLPFKPRRRAVEASQVPARYPLALLSCRCRIMIASVIWVCSALKCA